MKRFLATVMTAAAIAGGTVAGVPSPSSAMPRDACLDEAHWQQQMSWYEVMELRAFDTFAAWGAAVHESNPVSGESWTANLATGYQTVFTQADYSSRLSTANHNYGNAQLARMEFEATAPC
jgi:hypothetical protein